MRMNNKKGQADGGAVYILILLMAFFILIYVILLPRGEREELLNITSSTDAATGEAPAKTVVLSESPGKVYSFTSNLQTINIEPIHVYSRDESTSFTLIKSMTVSRNLLKDNFKTVLFDLTDLSELKEVKLFFLITESKGPMTIYLNGKLLYEGLLTSSQMPLELPLANLQEKNRLEFYSASPGIRVFSSNYYIMQDVQLIKTLKVEKIDLEEGKSFDIEKVLMLGDGDKVTVGAPLVDGAKVTATIKSHGRLDKVRIVKFRRRKHHRKQMGHRQYYTEIEITGIAG